ncbi:unnamed protein product [Rotaria sordida]|uniref:Uncharacterized protein n=2 Tax=Rotaria sordida TaxID=392033 RepID=A0A815HB52_9BILA|nr:unnamed protein product [Rotaria sordida]CAF1601127.1 unnamed protein product [Rotaria sordida]
MSALTRNSSNPPPYFYDLNPQQQKNWMKTTRRMEKNEELRAEYPPFQSPSNFTVIHLHHYSSIETIEELIMMAKTTYIYTIDTESQVINKVAQGALVQIQFIHSIHESTLILIEMFYLPNQNSLLFKKIKELCAIIFREENKKITWGPFDNEFKNFHSYELFEKGKIKNTINLQDRFSDWYNKPPTNTHPAKESREEQTTWSLQDAVRIAFQQFLDKNETVNKWRCGLDFKLNTWKKKLFSKNHYNANEEQEKRMLMIKYAVADCTAVTKLYFMIYPSNSTIQTTYETPPTASTNITLNIDDLSDISEEEEEPQILMPYFVKPPQILIPKFGEQNYLTIETTEEEMNEFNVQKQQQAQEKATTTTKLSKSERQRKKNLKAQLKDDDIYTSHQLTINRHKKEVLIGFKSETEQEQARIKMPINYFSRKQYEQRWAGHGNNKFNLHEFRHIITSTYEYPVVTNILEYLRIFECYIEFAQHQTCIKQLGEDLSIIHSIDLHSTSNLSFVIKYAQYIFRFAIAICQTL